MLLLVGAAVTSVVDVKMCLAAVAIFVRSQWSRGLRRRSTAARLLRLWFRIPFGYFSVGSVVFGELQDSATS
jgi:4-amino-4-deoxy-L-arabinose transferase-like glycosyltransferase